MTFPFYFLDNKHKQMLIVFKTMLWFILHI